ELDPDLRLYARLTLGRGWRRITLVAIWALAVAGITSGYVPSPFADPRAPRGTTGMLPLAVFVLLLAPARSVTRLFDLERGGLLDSTRMCGRAPLTIVSAFVAGSTAPYLAAVAVLLATHVQTHPAAPAIAALAIALAGAVGA